MDDYTKHWNYDRIVTAQAQMNVVQNDMSRILFAHEVSKNTKDRMVMNLRHAADDLDKMIAEAE